MMAAKFPSYPKSALLAQAHAACNPNYPGDYEFQSEADFAKRVNGERDDAVAAYAEENGISEAIALAVLREQVAETQARIEAYASTQWGLQ